MSQEELDKLAAIVKRVGNDAGFAAGYAARAAQTGDTSKLRDVYELAKQARTGADNAFALLLTAGAKRPGEVSVARDTIRLDQLDTPATRALLSALEAAALAGATVDKERGWIDGNGEPIGFGETLGGMASQLQTEIFGPKGRSEK